MYSYILWNLYYTVYRIFMHVIEWDCYKDLFVPFRELYVDKGTDSLEDINSKAALQIVEALFTIERISSDIPQDRNTEFVKRELGDESKTLHGKESEALIGILCENDRKKEGPESLLTCLQRKLEDAKQKLDTVLNQGLKGESSVEKDSFSYDVSSYYCVEDVQIATYVTTSVVQLFEDDKEFPLHLELDLCTNAFQSSPTYMHVQASEKETGTRQLYLVIQMEMLEVYLRRLNIPQGMEEQARLQIFVPLLEIQSLFLPTAPPDSGQKDTSSQLQKHSPSTGSGSSEPSSPPHHSWQSNPGIYPLSTPHTTDKTTSGAGQAASFADPTANAVQCTSADHDAVHVSGLLLEKSSSDSHPTRPSSCDPYTTAVTESEDACTVPSEATSGDSNSDLVVVTDYTPPSASKRAGSPDEVSEPLASAESPSTSSSKSASVDFHANEAIVGDGIHHNSQESDGKCLSCETEEPLPLEISGYQKSDQQLIEMEANGEMEANEPTAAAESVCSTDASTASCYTKSRPKAVVRLDIDLPSSSFVHCALLLDYPSDDISKGLCIAAAKSLSLSTKLSPVAGSKDPSIPVGAEEIPPSEPSTSCSLNVAARIDNSCTDAHSTSSQYDKALSKSHELQPSLQQEYPSCTLKHPHHCGPQLINLLTSTTTTSDQFFFSILCDLAAPSQLFTRVYSPKAMERIRRACMPTECTKVAIHHSCSDSTRNSQSAKATHTLKASLKQKLSECSTSSEQLQYIPHAYRPPLLTSAKADHFWTSAFFILCDLAARSEVPSIVILQSQLCKPVSSNARDCTPTNCPDFTSCCVDRSDMLCHPRSTLTVPTATSCGSQPSEEVEESDSKSENEEYEYSVTGFEEDMDFSESFTDEEPYPVKLPTLSTPIRSGIQSRPMLRPTKKKMSTPLRLSIKSHPALRKTMESSPTPLRKHIQSKPSLNKTKKSMPTPLKRITTHKVTLRRTKQLMLTPMRKEMEDQPALRKTKRSIPTPVRKAIETKKAQRKTRHSHPSPLRLAIEAKQTLHKMKRTLPTPIHEAIKRGPATRRYHFPIAKAKWSIPTPGPIRTAIQRQPALRKTMSTTPARREIEDQPQLRRAKRPMNQEEINQQPKPKRTRLSVPMPVRKGKPKMRRNKHSLPSPLRLARTPPTPTHEAIKQGPTSHIPIIRCPAADDSSKDGHSSNTGSDSSSSGSESAGGGDSPEDSEDGRDGGCSSSGSGQDGDDDKKPPNNRPVPGKKKKRRKKKRIKVKEQKCLSEECLSPTDQEHLTPPASDDSSDGRLKQRKLSQVSFKKRPSNTQKRKRQVTYSSLSATTSDEPSSRKHRKGRTVRKKALHSPDPKLKPRGTKESSPDYRDKVGRRPKQAKEKFSYSPDRKNPVSSLLTISVVLSLVRPLSAIQGQEVSESEDNPASSGQQKDTCLAGPHSTSVVQTDTAPIEGDITQPPSPTLPSPLHQCEVPSISGSDAMHTHAGVPVPAEDTAITNTSSPLSPLPSTGATRPPENYEFSIEPGVGEQEWSHNPEPRKVSDSSFNFAVLQMHGPEAQPVYDYDISESSSEVLDYQLHEGIQETADFPSDLEDGHKSLHHPFNSHASGFPRPFTNFASDSNGSDIDCAEPCSLSQQCSCPADGGHEASPSPGPGCQEVHSGYQTDGHHKATPPPNPSQFSSTCAPNVACVGGEVFTLPPEANSSDNPSQHHFDTQPQSFASNWEPHGDVPVTSPPPSQQQV